MSAPAKSGTSFTPGPWRVKQGPICLHVVSDDGRFSTGCISFDGASLANARLIAAAPDYWDAAEQLTTDWSELEGDDAGYVAIPKAAYEALMRAHAKAEGRD